MPGAHSKHAQKEDGQGSSTAPVITSIFFSVLQHCIQSQAEPLLIRRLVRGDPVVTAQTLANTSSVIGILGLFVNQLGGKLSDKIGRRPGFFIGPLVSIITGLLTHSFKDSFVVVVACRILRILFTSFSSSVMVGAALSDLVSGKELAIAGSKIGAAVGAAVFVSPWLETAILTRTNMAIHKPALALATIGALHVAYLAAYMPETNRKMDPRASWAKELFSLKLSSVNPFKFMSLFRKDKNLERVRRAATAKELPAVAAAERNRNVVKKLVVVSTLTCALEGKNIADFVQVWQREHLRWQPTQFRNFGVTYGTLCFLAGQFVTPALLKTFSARGFTSLTNFTNFVGFYLRGAAESTAVFWSAVPLMLPGVNGSAGAAIKAMATDRAIAAGIGRGELSAYLNNLRALSFATIPILYGQLYAMCVRRNIYPGHVFLFSASLGAALPELLQRMLPKEEMQPLGAGEKEKIEEVVRKGKGKE